MNQIMSLQSLHTSKSPDPRVFVEPGWGLIHAYINMCVLVEWSDFRMHARVLLCQTKHVHTPIHVTSMKIVVIYA